MSRETQVEEDRAVAAIVRRALEEDVGEGDATSIATVDAASTATAAFIAKENGVLSGAVPAGLAFQLIDPGVRVAWTRADGDEISKGDVIGRVSGNARAILTAERTALNILQRMSGIATITARMKAAARPHRARVLDTRKTAPGLRMLDKMAVAHGGGVNHRIGLFDMILIKDNHIAAAGSISRALKAAQSYRLGANRVLKIEIEARTLDEVREVVVFWESYQVPERILLDNMARRTSDGRVDASLLKTAVDLIGGRIETEASGNVDLSTIAEIAATGVDYISSGALTHSVRALDISLEFRL